MLNVYGLLLCVQFSPVGIIAGSADPIAISEKASVGRIERMPTLTGDLFSLKSSSVSAPHIVTVGERLKMLRIDAACYSAGMVKFESVVNGANRDLVNETMGAKEFSLRLESAVSASGIPGPKPAAAVGLRRDKFHEAFDNGFSHVTPFKSHRSGSRGASNADAGRFYYSGGVA